MTPILILSCGQSRDPVAAFDAVDGARQRVIAKDLYDLPDLALERFSSLLISMHSDQRFLASCTAQIAAFLDRGGTVVANGHVAYPFLSGLTCCRTIEGCGVKDLQIERIAEHPVWTGVAADELTFRRGVAGFYGRVWHEAPAGAQVIHALGRPERPVDFMWAVGRGRVLFHGGNDLWQFGAGDTTARIVPQLIDWLERQGAVS